MGPLPHRGHRGTALRENGCGRTEIGWGPSPIAATEGPRYGKLATTGATHCVSDCAKAVAGYQVSSSCSMAYIAAAARVETPILS
jgi:hypothetical protein